MTSRKRRERLIKAGDLDGLLLELAKHDPQFRDIVRKFADEIREHCMQPSTPPASPGITEDE